MSLILDALRKLERDKQARDSGVVVVGQVPWRGRDRGRGTTRVILGGLILLVFAVAGALVWLARPDERGAASPAPPPPSEGVPAPALPAPGTVGSPPAEVVAAPPLEATSPVAPPPREVTLPEPRPSLPSASTVEAPGPTAAAPPARTPAGEEPSTRALGPTMRPPLLLTAISERDGKPIAVLNDRLVREGDSIDGVRVLSIGPTEVEVEIDGRRETIRF